MLLQCKSSKTHVHTRMTDSSDQRQPTGRTVENKQYREGRTGNKGRCVVVGIMRTTLCMPTTPGHRLATETNFTLSCLLVVLIHGGPSLAWSAGNFSPDQHLLNTCAANHQKPLRLLSVKNWRTKAKLPPCNPMPVREYDAVQRGLRGSFLSKLFKQS